MDVVVPLLVPSTDLTDAHLAALRTDHLYLLLRKLEAFLLGTDAILTGWPAKFAIVSHCLGHSKDISTVAEATSLGILIWLQM